MKCTEIEREELTEYIQLYDFREFLTGKTILLTGAKGMVGSGIIKWLLLQNQLLDTNTRILASTRNPTEIPAYIEEGDNILYVPYGREEEIREPIHYIIHGASPTRNQEHMKHPVETFRTNVDGVEKLLEVAKKQTGCSMLYLSSEEVYGLPTDNSPAMTEDMVGAIDSLNLRSCYPLGKKASEFLCFASAAEYGLDVKIIRPTVIQGLFQPYDEPRVVNELLRCILEQRNLVMKSDGLTRRCMLYSLDAVAAMFTVLFRGEAGQAYNATNPSTFLSVRDLADEVFQRFCPEIHTVYAQKNIRQEEGFLPHRSLLQDCSKLEKLGWKPRKGIEEIYRVDLRRFGRDG